MLAFWPVAWRRMPRLAGVLVLLPPVRRPGAMSREIDGRQYLVAAVGGHGRMDTKLGDSVIAWALPPR